MAEPVPFYPQIEPAPEAGFEVVNIRPYSERASTGLLDQAFVRAGRSLRQARDTAQGAFLGIQRAVVYVAEERPLHLVLGVAIAAFVAGSGLRIWRSHHE